MEQALKILVVDDSPEDQEHCRRLLLAGEDLHLELAECRQGAAGLIACCESPPDCILLDFRLPDMDGLEFLEQLRRGPQSTIPVVMLTGKGDEAIAVAAMKAGAQDYLVKNNLCAKTLDSAIRRAIEKADRQRMQIEALERLQTEYEDEQEKRRELEASLQIAGSIQQQLLPSGPPDVDGLDVCGICLPAETTGGDFFDYLPMADGSLGIVISDFSGHGIGPALLAAETRAYLRALARTRSDVGQIATIANNLLWEDTFGRRFATLFLAQLNAAERIMMYAAAGHFAHVVHPSGDFTALPAKAPPMGLFDQTVVPTIGPVTLASGDILLLATDGLFDMADPDHTLFGIDRCIQLIHAHRSDPVERILDELVDAARTFAQGAAQPDDLTIVIAKVK
jgi:serine phosphatase RsbU (regulator of sigma subunit)